MNFLKTPFFLHLAHTRRLVRSLGVPSLVVIGSLSAYYSLTIFSAILDGVGTILLASLFTSGGIQATLDLPGFLKRFIDVVGIGANLQDMLPVLIGIYLVNLLVRSGLLAFDGWVAATLRRHLQETIFRHYLFGDWAHMRNFSVGNAAGTATQEAMIIAKYLTSVVSMGYFLMSAAVITVLAAFTSLKIFFAFFLIATPLVFGMRGVIARQSKLSRHSAELRNSFSADITDCFNGLLQIHVESRPDFYIAKGLRVQHELTRVEILIGYCQAVLGSFNLLLPLVGLVVLMMWLSFFHFQEPVSMTVVASVGILGMRLANQFNGVVAAAGNLSRLSGSLSPVFQALELPLVRPTALIAERVASVQVKGVSYAYENAVVLKDVTLTAQRGIPVVLIGRSGRGKTTLANLVAGLYVPLAGEICYVGEVTGDRYPSNSHHARVGYVTQDIYLFKGTLRDNLLAGRSIDDAAVWEILEKVGAAKFVQKLGGLDAESTEAGRSLSGGQRRRLGIARVLLSDCDVLVLDEITGGLDQQNRQAVLELVASLAPTHIILLISHEEVHLPRQIVYSL